MGDDCLSLLSCLSCSRVAKKAAKVERRLAAQAEAAKRQMLEHGGELGGGASTLLDVTAAVVGDSDIAALGGVEQVFAVGDAESMLE